MRVDAPRVPVYKDFVLIQLAVLVFVIDRFTKFLVRDQLLFRESFPADGLFRFTHTHNTGSAFGIFQDQNTPLIVVSILGVGILIMIYRSQRVPSSLLRLSLGLQIGGAVGNLLDRLRLGHVTDFMDVGAWPVFNVADAAIITGLVILASATEGGRVAIIVSVTSDLKTRIPAGQVVKALAPLVSGGGGGGRPDFAEAGGKDPRQIDHMLSESENVVRGLLDSKE